MNSLGLYCALFLLCFYRTCYFQQTISSRSRREPRHKDSTNKQKDILIIELIFYVAVVRYLFFRHFILCGILNLVLQLNYFSDFSLVLSG